MNESLQCDNSQMKGSEQYFSLAVIGMLCKVVLTFESVDEMLECVVISYGAVYYITLYKVVLTFEYVDKILKCDYLNESY